MFLSGKYSCEKPVQLPDDFAFEVSTFTGPSSPIEPKLEPTPENLSPNLTNDITIDILRIYTSNQNKKLKKRNYLSVMFVVKSAHPSQS